MLRFIYLFVSVTTLLVTNVTADTGATSGQPPASQPAVTAENQPVAAHEAAPTEPAESTSATVSPDSAQGTAAAQSETAGVPIATESPTPAVEAVPVEIK